MNFETHNNSNDLQGKRVAILVADGFEQVEMTEPRKALDEAGAKTRLIALAKTKVKAWQHTKWGRTFTADLLLANADPNDFDALLLPGGVMNPDKLRAEARAVAFVKAFFEAEKPVAAICHGPWLLVEANVVHGRRVTSWSSIKTDLINAGADWLDQPAVIDDRLVTSRKPDDIPDFSKAMLEIFASAEQPMATV